MQVQRNKQMNSKLQMNFLQDMFKDAFENDKNLSADKQKQQLESPNEIDGLNGLAQSSQKTDVQKHFRTECQ